MPDRLQPGARITDAEGNVQDVTDQLTGAEDFFAAYKRDVDTPDPTEAGAWQRTDEGHKPGDGRSAYRVVYKTLRLVPYPPVEMTWSNMRVSLFCGDVERGGMRFEETIPGRRRDQQIIPEHGRVLHAPPANPTYLHCPNLHFFVAGWEDTVKAVSALEVIRIVDEPYEDPLTFLEAGRTAVAPLLALLEFEFGPRLLSTRLTEEIGETFEDWHWIRRIHTGTVYAESQAAFVHQSGQNFLDRARPLLEASVNFSVEEKARLRLASRWYWMVQEEIDPTLAFIQWWMIVETLEMPKTTDVRPVNIRIASLLECDVSAVKPVVGRLFGLRSRLVHGEERGVTAAQLHAVEVVARLLLGSRCGVTNTQDRDAARKLLGSTAP